MRFSPAVCGLALVLLVVALPSPARAAVYGGTLQAVSSNAGQTGQIVVRFASRDQSKTFRLGPDTQITLDGKRAALGDLTPGLQVTVVTTTSGAVTRVSAREASVRPDPPAATEKPSPRPTPSGDRGGPATVGLDWPQFRGPNRDNRSPETGLSTDWSRTRPQLAWTARGLGEGYSTVSVAHDLVFTMGNQRDSEQVLALHLKTGRPAWSSGTGGSAFREGAGNGPRSVPTVDGDRLYALGATGDLVCLDARTGRQRWSKNILREFGGRNITWGICESVLIDGERLICTPGGPGGTMVALNKQTGSVLWRAAVPGNPAAAYASPIAIEVAGVRQYVNFTARGVVGIRAADGEFLWQEDSSSNGTANCSAPVFYEDHVFSASGYGTGGALVRLTSSGNATSAQRVYHTGDMKNHHGGMVVVDGYLYGSNDPGILTCLDLQSGDVKWRDRSVGKGSIVYADGHIILRSEQGPVAIVEATPDGYREKGRFDQPQRSGRPAWPYPVVADGKLFLRDMDVLLCYDLSGRR